MSDDKNVVLPDLTHEQMEVLRKRFKMEEGLGEDGGKLQEISISGVYTDPIDYSKGAVFTNATAGLLIIDDLGIKAPNGRFTPETFQPYETKDLRRLYNSRELRRSKYLIIAQESNELNNNCPLLLPGVHTKEEIVKRVGEDTLASLATANPKGSFEDPEFGKTDYDLRLVEIERREHQEDLETRKGYNA